jgi:hypothetical protein
MTFRKTLFATIAAVGLVTITSATAAPYWTPETEACVTRAGYQKSDWQARRVPAGPPADGIRACMAKVRARAK